MEPSFKLLNSIPTVKTDHFYSLDAALWRKEIKSFSLHVYIHDQFSSQRLIFNLKREEGCPLFYRLVFFGTAVEWIGLFDVKLF